MLPNSPARPAGQAAADKGQAAPVCSSAIPSCFGNTAARTGRGQTTAGHVRQRCTALCRAPAPAGTVTHRPPAPATRASTRRVRGEAGEQPARAARPEETVSQRRCRATAAGTGGGAASLRGQQCKGEGAAQHPARVGASPPAELRSVPRRGHTGSLHTHPVP